MMTKAEATEILDTEFDSVCFGKVITVRLFLINLPGQFNSKTKKEFECDMQFIMKIIRKVKCFSEHNFKMAGKLFYELLDFSKTERNQNNV